MAGILPVKSTSHYSTVPTVVNMTSCYLLRYVRSSENTVGNFGNHLLHKWALEISTPGRVISSTIIIYHPRILET